MNKSARSPHADSHNLPWPFGKSSVEVAMLCALKNGIRLEEVMRSLKLEFETRDFENLSENAKEILRSAWKLSESYIPFRRTGDLFEKYALNRLEIKAPPADSFHLCFWTAIHSDSINEFKANLEKVGKIMGGELSKSWTPPGLDDGDAARFWDYARRFKKMESADWDRLVLLGRAERHMIWLAESLLAAFAFFILIPFFALICVLILFLMGRPVFYVQKRVGRFGKPFTMIKFRTMCSQKEYMESKNSAQWPGVTVGDDERVTPFGRVLRKYKLDELPQLLNIALGHMEFVGYRPELPEMVAAAEADYAILCQQRPGITDPASLAFINENEILSVLKKKHGDDAYVRVILPIKTSKSLNYYLRRIKSGGDLGVIYRTVCESFLPGLKTKKIGLPEKDVLPDATLSAYERTGCEIWVDSADDHSFTCNVDYGGKPRGEAMPMVIFKPAKEPQIGTVFPRRRGRQAINIPREKKSDADGEILIRCGLLPEQRKEFRKVFRNTIAGQPGVK